MSISDFSVVLIASHLHGAPGGAVAMKMAMLQLHPSPIVGLGDEAHLDLIRLGWIGLHVSRIFIGDFDTKGANSSDTAHWEADQENEMHPMPADVGRQRLGANVGQVLLPSES